MAFSGLFLRHFLGDKPGSAAPASSVSDSPDILLEGTTPVDAATLTTSANYGQEPPNTLFVGAQVTNYVYVRALNTTAGAVDGRIWLWYADAAMLLWPENWISNTFWVNGVNQNWANVHASGSDQIVVADAFAIVSPITPQQHYCMIAISETQQETPPRPPLPDRFQTIDDFVQWVASNPNVAWRDTVDQPASGPGATFNWTTQLQGPDQGPTPVDVGIQCQDMPVGSQYRFTVPGGQNAQGSWPPLDSGVRTIAVPDESYMVQTTWPGGVVTMMNVTWWANGTTPDSGAAIVPVIAVPVTGSHSGGIQAQHLIKGTPLKLTPQ